MNITRLLFPLLALVLVMSMSSSCCLSDIFDDDDVNPAPHNEGGAGDV